MKEQLLLLLELQKIDARVIELRKEIAFLPKKLAPAKQDLETLDGILQAEKQRLADNETWRKEQEHLIQMEEDAIRKAKLKLQAAKNSKDYTAASRELENKRRSKSEREEEVLKVMGALEKSRAEAGAHEKDIETLRSQVEAEESRHAELIRDLSAEAETCAEGRDALVAKLDEQLLKRYEHVLRKRGYAVAAVDAGVCQGCHMAVPPQLNNILARFDSIESCPRCGRLLYRSEIFDAPERQPEPEAQAEPGGEPQPEPAEPEAGESAG